MLRGRSGFSNEGGVRPGRPPHGKYWEITHVTVGFIAGCSTIVSASRAIAFD